MRTRGISSAGRSLARTSFDTGVVDHDDLLNKFDWTSIDDTRQRSQQRRIAFVVENDNNGSR